MSLYVYVPGVNDAAAAQVPASISDDQAMFVEPLAAACQITQQVSHVSKDMLIWIGRVPLLS